MSIWKENALGQIKSDMRNIIDKDIDDKLRQAMAQKQRHHRDMLKNPYDDWQSLTPNNISTQGAATPRPEPPKKTYPLEGQGVKLLKDLSDICHPEVLVGVLIDMTLSGDNRERAYAAIHKDTPIASIITNLLSDKDATVRYLAEKRVEAEGCQNS